MKSITAAKQRLQAYSGFSVARTLEKIKERHLLSDSDLSKRGINAKHCHTKVARSIRDRRDPTDIIWMFGAESDAVEHSLLTDAKGRVLVGAKYGSQNETQKFLGDDGFQLRPDNVMPLIKKISAKEVLL